MLSERIHHNLSGSNTVWQALYRLTDQCLLSCSWCWVVPWADTAPATADTPHSAPHTARGGNQSAGTPYQAPGSELDAGTFFFIGRIFRVVKLSPLPAIIQLPVPEPIFKSVQKSLSDLPIERILNSTFFRLKSRK